jgi:hypothetical protein
VASFRETIDGARRSFWRCRRVDFVDGRFRRGDELSIYYGGIHGPHGRPGHPPVQRKHRGALGRLTLKRDRFVSLEAGDDEGWLLTRPFRLPDGALHLNLDAASGQVQASLCDAGGKVLADYLASQPVRGDTLDAVVAWDDADPAALAGSTVRLRLQVRNAHVYSYWFASVSE